MSSRSALPDLPRFAAFAGASKPYGLGTPARRTPRAGTSRPPGRPRGGYGRPGGVTGPPDLGLLPEGRAAPARPTATPVLPTRAYPRGPPRGSSVPGPLERPPGGLWVLRRGRPLGAYHVQASDIKSFRLDLDGPDGRAARHVVYLEHAAV